MHQTNQNCACEINSMKSLDIKYKQYEENTILAVRLLMM
ncbi:hypothetical protein RNAN_0847 [Rheinheimera nanhaiensis E407-8]|uniref:Uncharacterized protein n=1 Tax=Rheinheimera nanhaiensis E407-8 TaxID=562729 RepID=I1DUZ9_9GAMM|nr:hypothetical protein RNAN_0847 [Rheinheimera nanhaiensis E407-8]